MLENVTALFCRGHQKFQPFADLPLPGELAEHWRSQRDFEGSIGFRRFHDRVRGNLITSNQKLRTTRFVVWQSSRGSAGCQPAIVGSLPTRFSFQGSARSRVFWFRGLAETVFSAKSAMTRRHRQHARRVRYPELPLTRVSLPAHTIFFVNTSSVPRRRKI